MAKIGRNDACPCGSGKKYKRCCATAVAPSIATAPAPPAHASAANEELCPCCEDRLNEDADLVLNRLLDGHVDDAEALCHKLIEDFPTQAEGIDLLSMICEKRGQLDRALDLLREASAIAHASPDYDTETRRLMRLRMTELELRA